MNQHPNKRSEQVTPLAVHGFTLVELLVTISIIFILIAVSVPTVLSAIRWAKTASGVNTIHVAATSAQAYAKRDLSARFEDVDEATIGEQPGEYSGVAMLFTPSNEIRLVQNEPFALNTGGSPLEPALNGYNDLPDRDYIQIDHDAGVIGIARNAYMEPIFLAPPFAIRFNTEGHLIQGQQNIDRVYYDANYDGAYRTSGTAAGSGYDRAHWYGQTSTTASYDPALWDPRSSTYDSSNFNATLERMELPFEEIESVIGVVTFSKPDLIKAGHTLASENTGSTWELNHAARDWIMGYGTEKGKGRPIYFNRFSGSLIKQRDLWQAN